ncbi:Hypothetical_protein [Hexamita inflata]|uniref:Hypothetical_protein n=1 Tax=Hexamita inflata TaxID=28002 RepID=A0AA86TNG0_9EUKA|nr:Hypothetical protein HINF_LOCUS10471 [Hexamita inflata]
MKYSFSTSLISYVSARVERTVFMLQLVVIQSFFKYLNRALVPTSQRQRVHVSDILNIIYLPCTQSQKQGTHENIILNCSYIRLCQGVSGACYCDRQLGFAPEADQCENCWSISQQALPNGCQPCAATEVFSPSSKTCVCDSSLGYTGVSGGCYCNFGIGLTQIIDNNGVKSCGCNQNTGHVLDASSSSLSCKCDSSTGHSGQPGACFCNKQTGNFGYPGNCQCNYNLQFVGSPGSCMNCSSLNARASQFNGKDFCQCNNDSGYGSPDTNGKCKLCLISNSIIQIDNDWQYQCIACAATEKVVNNMCVCTSQRISRININKN